MPGAALNESSVQTDCVSLDNLLTFLGSGSLVLRSDGPLYHLGNLNEHPQAPPPGSLMKSVWVGPRRGLLRGSFPGDFSVQPRLTPQVPEALPSSVRLQEPTSTWPVGVNKVLLEHNHTLFTHGLWLLSGHAGRAEWLLQTMFTMWPFLAATVMPVLTARPGSEGVGKPRIFSP